MLFVTACDEAAPTVVADADVDSKSTLVIPVLPMNIVVTDHVVEVYMETLDYGGIDCAVESFPVIGKCSVSVDGNPCAFYPADQSCITDLGVELDGKRLVPANTGGRDPWTYYYDESLQAGSLALVVAGCGHRETRIPLGASPLLQVQVAAVPEGDDLRVSWTTDRPETSAITSYGSGLFALHCHAEGVSEYLFRRATSAVSASVQAIDTRTDLTTEFGPATVWRAGLAYVDLQ